MTKEGFEYNSDHVGIQVGFDGTCKSFDGASVRSLFENLSWIADMSYKRFSGTIKVLLIMDDWREMHEEMWSLVHPMERVEHWQEPGVKFNFMGHSFIVLRTEKYNLSKTNV